jgi:hypothetical protein
LHTGVFLFKAGQFPAFLLNFSERRCFSDLRL